MANKLSLAIVRETDCVNVKGEIVTLSKGMQVPYRWDSEEAEHPQIRVRGTWITYESIALDYPLNEIFYLEHDPDYETMPWRIYMRFYGDESIEIAKAYDRKHAEIIVNALEHADMDLVERAIMNEQNRMRIPATKPLNQRRV